MNIRKSISYKVSSPQDIDSIRNAQTEHQFLIPSDYVFFLTNLNKLEFDNIPLIRVNADEFEFEEFYDLENIIWDLNHHRNLINNYNHDFWLDGHLAIGTFDDHRILIGNSINNINNIYIYNNEECQLRLFAPNVFNLINDKLFFRESP